MKFMATTNELLTQVYYDISDDINQSKYKMLIKYQVFNVGIVVFNGYEILHVNVMMLGSFTYT